MAKRIPFGPAGITFFERHSVSSGAIQRQDGTLREYSVIFTGTNVALEAGDMTPAQLMGAIVENTSLPLSIEDRYYTIVGGYYFEFLPDESTRISQVFGVASQPELGFDLPEGSDKDLSQHWKLKYMSGGNSTAHLKEKERGKNNATNPGYFGWTLIAEEAKNDALRPKSGKELAFFLACPEITEISVETGQLTKNTHTVKCAVTTDLDVQEASYTWNWGDGSDPETTLVPTATHRYHRPDELGAEATIKVTLQTALGCVSQATTIVPLPQKCPTIKSLHAKLGSSRDQLVEVVFVATLEGLSQPDQYRWQWNQEDPIFTFEPKLIHSFAQDPSLSQEILVTLTLEGPAGCTCDKSITVTIPQPAPVELHLEREYLLLEEQEQPVKFILSINGATPEVYHWDLGDGTMTTSEIPSLVHRYERPVGADLSFTVKAYATGPDEFVSETRETEVLILKRCPTLSNFQGIGDHSQAGEWAAQWSVEVSGPSPDLFEWNFGDGKMATTSAPSVTHIYALPVGKAATWEASVRALGPGLCESDPLRASLTAEISCPTLTGITQTLLSPSSEEETAVTVSFEVQFSGASPAHFKWDFGDGKQAESTSAGITHTYQKPVGEGAIYLVTLVTQGPDSCEEQQIITEVRVEGMCPVITAVTAQIATAEQLTQAVTVTVSTERGVPSQFEWNWGDGSDVETSPHLTAIHHYERLPGDPREWKIEVRALGPGQCSDTGETTVTILGLCPDITAFELVPGHLSDIDQLISASLSVLHGEGSTYQWNWGDGSLPETTTSPAAEHRYPLQPGDARSLTVRVQVDGPGTCCSQASGQVMIPGICPIPSGLHVTLTQQGDQQHAAQAALSFKAGKADRYEWDWGDGSEVLITQQPNAQHLYLAKPGGGASYLVTVQAIGPDSCRCSERTTVKIPGICPKIRSFDTVRQQVEALELQVDFEVQFHGLSAERYRWDFADGSPIVETTTPHTSHAFIKTFGQERNLLAKVTAIGPENCETQAVAQLSVPALCPVVGEMEVVYVPKGSSGVEVQVKAEILHGPGLRYQWEWGDGHIEVTTEPKAKHLYPPFVGNARQYQVKVQVEGPGQCACSGRVRVRIPGICPQITTYDLTLLPEEIHTEQRVLAKVTVDHPEGVAYLWNWGDGSLPEKTNSPEVSHVYPRKPGENRSYTVMVTATGPETCETCDTSMIDIPGYCPKVVDHQLVLGVLLEKSLEVSLTLHLAQGTPDQLQWDWGDGSPLITTSGIATTLAHTYLRHPGDPQAYTVIVQGIGPGTICNLARSVPVTIPGICPEPISIQVIETIEVSPTQLQVTLVTEVALAQPSKFIWNWGDDSPMTTTSEATAQHIFDRLPGDARACTIGVTLQGPGQCSKYLEMQYEVPGLCPRLDRIEVAYDSPAEEVQLVEVSLEISLVEAEIIRWDWGDGSAIETTHESVLSHHYARNAGDDQPYLLRVALAGPGACEGSGETEILIEGICPQIDHLSLTELSETLESLEVEAYVATSKATPTMYRWDWGDGSPVEESEEAIFRHTYTRYPGKDRQYDMSIVVLGPGTSGKCELSVESQVLVRGYCPEILGIHLDTESNTQESSQLIIAKATMVHGHAEKYLWDWGDGSPLEELLLPEASHVYDRLPGAHRTLSIVLKAIGPDHCKTTASVPVEIQGLCPQLLDWHSELIAEDADSVTYRVSLEVSDSALIPEGLYTYRWIWGDETPDATIEETYTPTHEHRYLRPKQDQIYKVQFAMEGPGSCHREGCVKVKVEGSCAVVSGIESTFCSLTETHAELHFRAIFRQEPQPASLPTHFVWTWDDGSPATVTEVAHVSKRFNRSSFVPVTHRVRVVASGGGCDCQSTFTLTVTLPGNCPILTGMEVVYGDTGAEWQEVTLIATVRGGQPATFIWNLGDGSTQISTTQGWLRHRYPHAEHPYRLTVTVTGRVDRFEGKSCRHTLERDILIDVPAQALLS